MQGYKLMKLKAYVLPVLLLVLSTTSGAADHVAREITPLGANAMGNADGTIPPWTGGLPKRDLGSDGEIPDPFAADQRLFTISAADLGSYADKLTAGQLAMLEKYPDTYTLPVFPSRRSASYPDFVYSALDENRKSSQLVSDNGRQGVVNSKISSPFPEPESGLEAIWNHVMRWRGILLERYTSWVPVTASGRYRPILLHEEIAFPYASPTYLRSVAQEDGKFSHIPEYRRAMIAVKQKFLSPGRLSGSGSLLYDSYDYTRYERIRWVYPANLKRVVRLPRARLDQPVAATSGIIDLDDQDMFRGSTELFDWELEPPMEKLIPYNAYRFKDRSLAFDDIVSRHHLNQDLSRYELHRVWRVTATAKSGQRSTYSKRVFYLDEDSWQIVLSEKYDQDGNLAMYAEAHTLNYYNVPLLFPGVSAHYKLDDGRFLIQNINNMLPPHRWLDAISARNFSPNALLDYIR